MIHSYVDNRFGGVVGLSAVLCGRFAEGPFSYNFTDSMKLFRLLFLRQ
jgi:hypothetical protein